MKKQKKQKIAFDQNFLFWRINLFKDNIRVNIDFLAENLEFSEEK